MKIVKVKKTPVNYEDFVKRSAKESDYTMFVTEPTTLVDADTGDILAIYEELPINTDDVLKALNAIRYDTLS